MTARRDTLRLAAATLRHLLDHSVEGPWEVQDGSPSMGGGNWTLRTKGKPGIRASVSEYQHGAELSTLIVTLRATAGTHLEMFDTALRHGACRCELCVIADKAAEQVVAATERHRWMQEQLRSD